MTARVASHRADELAITVITVEEQLSGWYRQLRRAKDVAHLARIYQRLTDTVTHLSRLRILTFSEQAILHFKTLKASRLGVGSMDLRIAAIALEHQASVATRNVRDFQRIPNLVVEDWSK